MKKRLSVWLLVGLLATITALLGLLATEVGSRWAVGIALKALPGEANLEKIQWGLLERFRIDGLSYRSDEMDAHIEKLEFDWQPSRLFSKTLKITQLVADGVSVTLKPVDNPKEDHAPFPDSLPLPVKPEIDNLLLTNLRIAQNDQVYAFRKIQLAVATENENIRLKTLRIDSDLIRADAQGSLATTKGLPLNLVLKWQVNLEQNGQWQGSTKLDGTLGKLHIYNRLTSPFNFNLHGDLLDLTATPSFNLQGEWTKLLWPFADAPVQIQSPSGNIQLTGNLDSYRLKIYGALVQQFLPDANLTLDSTGSLTAIQVSKLDITSSAGFFHLSGNADWRQSPVFDVKASGVDFNPAILNPGLPGSLNFSTTIKGNIAPTANQVTIELNKISGQLRQQPVAAMGTLELKGEKLKISGLQIESGNNQLAVNGQIDKTQGGVTLSVDMPKLATLWPGLAGSLEGGGKISGGWGNPAVNLTLNGKALALAEHKIRQLNLAADYRPDNKATSTLDLDIAEIDSGGMHVDGMALTGIGSLERHGFALGIRSPHGHLMASLGGSWNQPNWRGALQKLEITETSGRPWTLAKPAPLRITQKANGLEISMEQSCLNQGNMASLCSRFNQSATGEKEFHLNATALPADLLAPWLDKNIKLATTLDAVADINLNKRGIYGTYSLNTSPTLLSFKGKDFHLQASQLAGKLDGESVTTDLDLHLVGSDYVKSRLQANIGKAQTIAGKLTAEMADFSPVRAFVPQIRKIGGHLSADLDLNGSLTKPLVRGYLNLDAATLGMDSFGLNAIRLHGNVDSSQGNRLIIQGSAQPFLVNDPEKPQNLDLETVVNLDADIRQTPVLRGDFAVELPSTVIRIRRPGFNYAFNLERSAMRGRLLDKKITAKMDLTLPKKDFVRGEFGLDGNDSNALSGRINAALHDFEPLEAFVPDLSNVKGSLTADVQLGGTRAKPEIDGKVVLADAQADVDRLGIAFRNINLQADTPVLTDDLLQIRGAAESGGGKITLDGSASLDPALQHPLKLSLRGKDFDVAKTADAEAAISPDLLIAANDAGTRITGTLAVPKAILKMQEIPENAVKVSPDEIILGETPPEAMQVSAPGLFADVLVTLGKQVSFSGQGLKTDLKGQLHIVKENDKLALQGNVNLANASYKSYGQDLTVRKGQFVFNGPADNPWVDVEAIRLSRDKKVTAVLHLSGLLENPQTRISSEPSLPESEALAYLVTGGPLNQVSKSDGNMLASAAISYGADQAGWLADKLGFSDFSVQQGSTLKDTLLVMGKYLTPDFYMGAKVGMFNKQAVMVLKHRLIDNLNVETQAGTSQRVKLNYEFDGD